MRAQSPLIISRPDRQSGAQHAIFGALTVTVWALWFYLWLPLITAILWMVGLRWAYIQVFKGNRGVSLGVILWITLSVIVIVAYWSSYNNIRYASKTQRRHAQPLYKAAIQEKFNITSRMLSLLLHERRLNLHFDESEQLIHVDAVAETPLHPPAAHEPYLTASPQNKGSGHRSALEEYPYRQR